MTNGLCLKRPFFYDHSMKRKRIQLFTWVTPPLFVELEKAFAKRPSYQLQPVELSLHQLKKLTFDSDAILLVETHCLNQSGRIKGVASPNFKEMGVKTVALARNPNPLEMGQYIEAGVTGYIGCFPVSSIVRAVQILATDGYLFDPQTLRSLAAKCQQHLLVDDDALTKTERHVLVQLAHGLSNKTIGNNLDITVNTVKTHLRHIFKKLDVTDRTQAAVWVWQNNLIEPCENHPQG